MRIVAVIQARMGSSRLPGKVLLPICGIPLAILAAKRAQRNTYEVRIATTVDPLDDILVEMAKEADIPVVRGNVEDVLGRFVEATADLPDEALVVRLTADNVFPDADLIGMIVDEFLSKGATSLVAATPESGLPYVGCRSIQVRCITRGSAKCCDPVSTRACDAMDKIEIRS